MVFRIKVSEQMALGSDGVHFRARKGLVDAVCMSKAEMLNALDVYIGDGSRFKGTTVEKFELYLCEE